MSWLKSFGSSIASGIAGSAVNALAGNWSAKQNAKLARDNWRYQQSNAHQLEVQDLRAAGLNPILSATNSQMAGMSSVSAPAVSDSGMASASMNAFSAKVLKSMDMEMDEKRLGLDLKRVELEKERLSLDEKIGQSNIDVNSANANYLKSETSNSALRTAQDIRESSERIRSSIATTAALVGKYGAESAQARQAVQESMERVKNLVEQRTGLKLENAQLEKVINDPQSRIIRKMFERGERGENLSADLLKLGTLVGLVNPFGNASFGKSGVRVGSHRSDK